MGQVLSGFLFSRRGKVEIVGDTGGFVGRRVLIVMV